MNIEKLNVTNRFYLSACEYRYIYILYIIYTKPKPLNTDKEFDVKIAR